MFFVITIRKKVLIFLTVFIIISLLTVTGLGIYRAASLDVINPNNPELTAYIEDVIKKRYEAILENNPEYLKPFYHLKSANGINAYDHQVKKIKYLYEWSAKQGVTLTDIDYNVTVRRINHKANGCAVNFSVFTTYSYAYKDQPDVTNGFKTGSYHSMDISGANDNRIIQREWYTDPFADSLNANLKTDSLTTIITAGQPKDFSSLNQRRKDALAYAEKYSGGSLDVSEGFLYNKKYKNYNYSGGDCTNFASQVLYEGGKFKMNGTWGYFKEGTKAWVNANALKDYLLYSGRASTVAYGTYSQVLKASYLLQPGDIIAYCKKGKVAHISVVAGADSKGYTLVNCHNADRFKVPWDLGWNDSGITFRLIHVHY